ncbi:MAG: glycosyltransferase family 2 protein [Planctomycetota bacterium]|nr:glycosyltransferase family 2 protein [Planctomycetota bacterium]
MSALHLLIGILAIVLMVPAAVLLVECLGGALFWSRHQARPLSDRRLRTVVLIPAHNEESSVGETVSHVLGQLTPGDQVIVVADNCTDKTAEVAQQAGARVLQRSSPDRGKGYALAFGVESLADSPPDVLVVLDADTRLKDGSVQRLVSEAAATGRPAQAVYLLQPSANATLKQRISALAFLTKSLGRAPGAYLLGCPNQLCGTGMAFPWEVIRAAPLASANIVEDVKLGIDLTIHGRTPLFCPDAQVIGDVVPTDADVHGQRCRWEHGHLYTMLTEIPRLLAHAIRRGRIDLLALALDLSVPPLSLFVLLLALLQVIAIVAGCLMSQWTAAWLNGASIAAVAVAVFLTWLLHGRSIVPFRVLLGIPLYIAWKIPLYVAFVVKRQTKWNRSAR